jgi:type VI secretion system protein ImpH
MQRRFDPCVIESFLRHPYKYRFFQAMRLIESWEQQVNKTCAEAEKFSVRIHFRNSVRLSFPPSEIEAVAAYDKLNNLIPVENLHAAVLEHDISVIEITQSFFGLLGIHGALPLHYTEKFFEADNLRRHPAGKAFFDLFSDRLTYLFYLAWKKYRLPVKFRNMPDDDYLSVLMSLAGLGYGALRNRLVDAPGSIPDDALANYTSMLRQRPVSARFLQRTLEDYFQVEVIVEQRVGHWYAIPENAKSLLGRSNMLLGRNLYAGDRVWQSDLRLRIWLGPLNALQFAGFLPNGQHAAALKKLLFLLLGVIYEYEVRLTLMKEEISGFSLGGHPMLLGWNTFLVCQAVSEDRSDTAYEILTAS